MGGKRTATVRVLLLGVGAVFAFVLGGVGPAQADNGPHVQVQSVDGVVGADIANAGATRCANCHRPATSKAATGSMVETQPAICYSCHLMGMGANTDVSAGMEIGSGLALRGGGFDTAMLGSGQATKTMGAPDPVTGVLPTSNQNIPALKVTAPTTSRHEVGGGSGTAWGNGPAGTGTGPQVVLRCTSCHDPHGNGNYRILRPIPTDSGYVPFALSPAVIADPAATPPVLAVPAVLTPGEGVNIPDSINPTYTTTNYWASGDASVPLDGYIANVSTWCSTCHTRYLAGTGSATTASGDETFTFRHRSNESVAGGANCITCHVSHGSNAAMTGVTNALLPGEVPAPAGDSMLLRVDDRGVCLMCHNI